MMIIKNKLSYVTDEEFNFDKLEDPRAFLNDIKKKFITS